MTKFKEGQVVQLASGGPKMTVTGESEFSGKICCQWFIKDELKYGEFNESSLVLYEAPAPVVFVR